KYFIGSKVGDYYYVDVAIPGDPAAGYKYAKLTIKQGGVAADIQLGQMYNNAFIDAQSIKRIAFEHTWVQAYLPGPRGLTWYDLDPSLKFQSFNSSNVSPQGIFDSIPYDPKENESISDPGYYPGYG